MHLISLKLLLLVASGSAIGGTLRYLCYGLVWQASNRLFHNQHHTVFTGIYGTLIVNLLGSFLIGTIFAIMPVKFGNPSHAFLFAGVLGGFTTFSTFSLEIYQLLIKQQFLPAFYYSFASLLFAISGVALGITFGKILGRIFIS